jgi:hypothetical protein
VFDEEFLILFGVDRAYRGIDDLDLVLQGIVMTRLERLRQLKHGRDANDVVWLEVFCIASVANHRLQKKPLTMLLIRKLGSTIHGSKG